MKKLTAHKALLLLLAVTLLLSACRSSDESGTGFILDEYRGKWIILNYWATWCAPCIKEIPELNALAKSGEFAVLGFNYDEKSGAELDKEIEMMGIEFETLKENPADALSLSRPEGLPVTYLFDTEGKLAAKLVGPQTEKQLRDRIASLRD